VKIKRDYRGSVGSSRRKTKYIALKSKWQEIGARVKLNSSLRSGGFSKIKLKNITSSRRGSSKTKIWRDWKSTSLKRCKEVTSQRQKLMHKM
jgi:hypothetical protein